MSSLLTELRTKHLLPLSVGVLGTLASFVLLFGSIGTNDIRSWEKFATAIQTSGLFQLYEADKLFNHPPLMGIFAWLTLEISSACGVQFAVLFKLFPVLTNVAAAVLLCVMWRDRAGLRTGAWAFALFSWGPCSILVAAFHGNTDCACAFFCLLALYFLERNKPAWAGFAMAAAINVKIIPLVLVCPMLASLHSWRDARKFCLAGVTGAVPFLIALAGVGSTFVANVFGYGSNLEPWGIRILMYATQVLPGVTPQIYHEMATAYDAVGKGAIIVSVLLLSVVGFWRRLDAARMVACACALFLLLAPGFGVQYVAYLTPLMFAVTLGWGIVYATVSGVFIGLVYAYFLIETNPLESHHDELIPLPAAFIGFAAWWTVLGFLTVSLRAGFSRTFGTNEAESES